MVRLKDLSADGALGKYNDALATVVELNDRSGESQGLVLRRFYGLVLRRVYGFESRSRRATAARYHLYMCACACARAWACVCVCGSSKALVSILGSFSFLFPLYFFPYLCGSGKALVSINGSKPPKNIRVKRDNIAIFREPMSSATKAELDAKYFFHFLFIPLFLYVVRLVAWFSHLMGICVKVFAIVGRPRP